MLAFSLFVALFTIPTAVNAKDTFSQIGITQTNDEIYAQLKTIVQGAVDEYCPYVGSNGENSCVEGFDPVEPTKGLNSKLLWKAGQGYNHLTGSVLMPALIMTPGDTTFTSNTGHEYIVPQQVTLTAGQQNGTFSIAEGSILSDPQEFVNGFLSFPTNPNRWLSWQSGFATPVDLNLLTNYMVMFANEGQVAFMQSSNLAYTVTVKDYSNQQYMRSQLNYYAAQAMELLEKGCTDINVCPDVFELFWSTWGSGIAMKSLWGGLYQLMHNLRPCMISDANGGKGLNRESLSQCRIADIPAPLRTGQPVPDESTLNYYRSRRQFLNQEWRGSKIDTVNDPQLQEWINSIQDAPALLQVEVLLYWESFTSNPQLQQSFVTLRNKKTQEQQDIIRNALQPGATNAKDHPLAYGYATTTCYSGSCTNYRAEGNFYMSGVAECPSSNPCTFFINSLHACVPCKPGYTCWCLYPMYARPDWNLLQAAATTTVTNAGWTPVCMQASHAANNNGLHFAQSTVVCTGGFRTSVFPIQDYNSQVTCAPF